MKQVVYTSLTKLISTVFYHIADNSPGFRDENSLLVLLYEACNDINGKINEECRQYACEWISEINIVM